MRIIIVMTPLLETKGLTVELPSRLCLTGSQSALPEGKQTVPKLTGAREGPSPAFCKRC
jgi:hypothetical protein